jgi:hypothetical protein
MLELILSLLEKIKELIKLEDKKIENLYKEFFKPIFEDMILIHKDYVSMFYDLNNIIHFDAEVSELEAAAKYLGRRRIELEPVREKMRAILEQSRSLALGDKGNAFIGSVTTYLYPFSDFVGEILGDVGQDHKTFLVPSISSRSTSALIAIQRVLDDEAKTSLSKQNYNVANEIKDAIDEAITNIRKCWADLSECYAAVYADSINHCE